MKRSDRLLALAGAVLGLSAFVTACVALAAPGWELDSNANYFRSSDKYQQLHLSRVTSVFGLLFTLVGVLASSWMLIK